MSIANIVLLALMVVCGLAAAVFFARGVQMRSTQASRPYDVARQEARHDMQVNFLRAGFLLFLALIFLGIYGLVPGEQGPGEDLPRAQSTTTATPSRTPTEPSAATIVPEGTLTATIELATLEPTSTVSPTLTPTAAATQTPAVATAVVNSPNGLWLREAPGGTQQLELIAHETLLELLPGRETAEDIEWQQVRTPAGNEGWVASEFLNSQ